LSGLLALYYWILYHDYPILTSEADHREERVEISQIQEEPFYACITTRVQPHEDIVGEFKKWGKIPLNRSYFSSRWGISALSDA
jgi:hypothetical protein